MPEIEFSSFSGSFQPTTSGAAWHAVGPEAALPKVYADIDFTLVPQNPTSSAARNQLPSKIVEAAAFGVAVVATPTPVIEEYCAGAYVPIDDWTDAEAVADRIRAVDPVTLGSAIRNVFVDRFATPVSATALRDLVADAQQVGDRTGS
jgi:glycosyltransferase involved in cell wall biosynthesis